MGMPQTPNRFPEIMDLLNQAVESERGIAVKYPTATKAWAARMRFYTKINDSRRESKEMFPLESPMWGRTPFDSLEIILDPPYSTDRKEVPTRILLRKLTDGYYSDHGIEVEEL